MKGVNVYDNKGKTADRYTAVYTKKINGEYVYLAMNDYPCHPQGIALHGFNRSRIDKPSYKHLGKKIKFEDLPIDCKKLIKEDLK